MVARRRQHGGGNTALAARWRQCGAPRRTRQAVAAATVAAAARGQSQSQLVRVFFSAQFAPFLHKNPELLLDGFDNFLGIPIGTQLLKGYQ